MRFVNWSRIPVSKQRKLVQNLKKKELLKDLLKMVSFRKVQVHILRQIHIKTRGRKKARVLTLRGIGGLILYIDRWNFQRSRRALKADGPGPPGCTHPLHHAGSPYFRSSATPAHLARRFSSNLEAFVRRPPVVLFELAKLPACPLPSRDATEGRNRPRREKCTTRIEGAALGFSAALSRVSN